MNLTKLEKGTILLFNEQEDEAEIYTYNKKLTKKLSLAAERNPQLYKLIRTDSDGGVCYRFSKKAVICTLFKTHKPGRTSKPQ